MAKKIRNNKSKKYKLNNSGLKYLLIIVLCTSACFMNIARVKAQQGTVRATISPSSILIGERATIQIEAIAPKGSLVIFPLYKDSLVSGVEVLKMLKPDTVMNEVMTIRQKYVVTSFDTTLYHIPRMHVIVNKDTLSTNDLALKVVAPQLLDSTVAYLQKLKNNEADSIDFNKLKLNDIKTIQKPKFVFSDYLGYIFMVLLIIIIIAAIVLAIYFWKQKKQKGYYFTPKIIRPAHEVAIENLDKLKDSKIWQKGQEKEYYTILTDILREYVKDRFNINAPEMITEEIVKSVHLIIEKKSEAQGLEQILTLADLVKFAKYIPFADENDLSMNNAYLFINKTKIIDNQINVNDKEISKASEKEDLANNKEHQNGQK